MPRQNIHSFQLSLQANQLCLPQNQDLKRHQSLQSYPLMEERLQTFALPPIRILGRNSHCRAPPPVLAASFLSLPNRRKNKRLSMLSGSRLWTLSWTIARYLVIHLEMIGHSQLLQTFIRSTLDPMPQIIPLLTMIRLAEDIVAEIQRRHCPPAETYVFGLSLQMWPVFQKGMTEHIESVKKLAEGSSASYFSRASTTTDTAVGNVSLHTIPQRRSVITFSTDLWTICCLL